MMTRIAFANLAALLMSANAAAQQEQLFATVATRVRWHPITIETTDPVSSDPGP
jgi:hypothetical protein